MSQAKQQVIDQLCSKLIAIARSHGTPFVHFDDKDLRRFDRMTQAQLQDELDRLNGVKKLEDLPDNHVCITVG